MTSYGVSVYSVSLSVLTAQLPDTPAAPTTAISGSNVVISWNQPFTGGSPITSYTIMIRLNDQISFTTELVNCNGARSDIVASRSCSIPISTLRNLPF